MKPLIISDLDGTLVNIMDELLEMIWHNFEVAVRPRDVTQYDVAASLQPLLQHRLSGQAALAAWLKENAWGNRYIYEVAKPYWNIQAAYQHAMSTRSVDITFCTGRPETEDVEEATLDWLNAWGYINCNCYFSSSFASGKAGVIDEILDGDKRPLWIVEDDVQAVTVMEEAVCKTDWPYKIFIVDRPWTKSARVSMRPGWHPTENILDLLKEVE